jgi:hypothetical protein
VSEELFNVSAYRWHFGYQAENLNDCRDLYSIPLEVTEILSRIFVRFVLISCIILNELILLEKISTRPTHSACRNSHRSFRLPRQSQKSKYVSIAEIDLIFGVFELRQIYMRREPVSQTVDIPF